MPKWLNKKIVILSFLGLVSLFFFSYDTQAQEMGDYDKANGSLLNAGEWNQLIDDFVMKASSTAEQQLYGTFGIGKAPDPSFLLDVDGDTKSDLFQGELSASYISSGAFGSNTSGGNYMFPNNVSIGTSTLPSYTLNVQGDIMIGEHPTSNKIYFGNTTNFFGRGTISTTQSNLGLFNTFSAGYITLHTNGAERLRVDSSGKVGIGTTDPTSLFHIQGNYSGGADNLIPQMKIINTSTTGGYAFIKTMMGTGYAGGYPELWVQATGGTTGTVGIRGVGNHDMTFWTNNAEKMRLTKDGNVGIGTTSPVAPLSVASTVAGDYINVGGGHIGGLDLTPTNPDHAVPLIYLEDNYISTTTISNSTFWKLSGDKLTASSSDWMVGIGTDDPASVLTIGNNKWISSINADSSSHVNMFRVNTNNQIEVGAPLILGSFEFAPDSGLVSFVDMPVTSASPINTPQAYAFKIDRDNIMSVYAESDGAGGIQNKRVGIGTIAPTSLLSISGGDLAIDHNKSIILNDNATNTTLLLGNYADGGGFTYGTSTSPLRYTASLAVEGDVKANRLCIEEDCKAEWGELVSAGMPTGSAGQLLVNTGASNWSATSSLFIASNGDVGIGTTGPEGKLAVSQNMSDYGASFTSPHIKLMAGNVVDNTGFVGITYAGSSSVNYGWSVGALRSSVGQSDFVWKHHNGSAVGTEWMRITNTGKVGIGTTSPTAKLSVSDTESGDYINVGGGHIGGLDLTPTADDHAVPLAYLLDNYNSSSTIAADLRWVLNGDRLYASSSDWSIGIGTTTYSTSSSLVVGGGVEIATDLTFANALGTSTLNMAGGDILGVQKLTVNTIDPLYRIKGVNYSTYAAAIVGGVKEEYVGRVNLRKQNRLGEYEVIIDFSQQKVGSDLWVFRKAIDWHKDRAEVLITPYGRFALTYYRIDGEKLILRADKPVEISYRISAFRHDWREWPTRAIDQEERAGFIID